MVDYIENKEIKALPIFPDAELCAKLKFEDILFMLGVHLISEAIQKITDGPWSHVGTVFRLDTIDRILLLESVEDMGVRFVSLSNI